MMGKRTCKAQIMKLIMTDVAADDLYLCVYTYIGNFVRLFLSAESNNG